MLYINNAGETCGVATMEELKTMLSQVFSYKLSETLIEGFPSWIDIQSSKTGFVIRWFAQV